jgi:type IV secretion system protein VirB10
MNAPGLKMSIVLVFILLASQSFAQNQAGTAQSSAEMVVPAGTEIPIVLTSFLNTRSSLAGDSFYAETVYPIYVQQRLVIPRGSLIKGTVTEVKRPGRIQGRGTMAIRIDSVMLPNGVERNLIASFKGIHGPGMEKLDRQKETVEMDSTAGEDVGTVAGTAAQGAIIGAMVGRGGSRGNSVAMGGIIGGYAGLAMVLASRGRELVLHPGTQFDIQLKQPVHFAWGEINFGPADNNRYRRPMVNQPRPPRKQQRSWYSKFGRRGLGRFIPWP